jgi:hypothetical protein
MRLLRAAAAERSQLDHHRDRLLRDREQLRAELARVERGLVEVDERRRLLDRLAPAAGDVSAQAKRGLAGDGPEEAADGQPAEAVKIGADPCGEGARELRGPQIRTQAVRILLADPSAPEALHYQDWFQRLLGAGFAVAGKDPKAVFLTQLTRSPVVRKSTQAGIYQLDQHAPERLRRELDDLHAQLRALTAPGTAAADLAGLRARRAALSKQISHAEKALEEALGLLGHHLDEIALLRAAG